MIKLVLDTNIFAYSFNNMDFDIFDMFWKPWESMMLSGEIISVDEAKRELLSKWGTKNAKGKWLSKQGAWIAKYSSTFLPVTCAEGDIITHIFSNRKFMDGIKEKSLLTGSPEADAMLVAKAKAEKAILVTAEKFKPSSEKIPNMCIFENVPYMNKESFYQLLKNRSSDATDFQSVVVNTDDTTVLSNTEIDKYFGQKTPPK